jgi:hypothetical protein
VLIANWQGAGLPKASLLKPVLATIEQGLIGVRHGLNAPLMLPSTDRPSMYRGCNLSRTTFERHGPAPNKSASTSRLDNSVPRTKCRPASISTRCARR